MGADYGARKATVLQFRGPALLRPVLRGPASSRTSAGHVLRCWLGVGRSVTFSHALDSYRELFGHAGRTAQLEEDGLKVRRKAVEGGRAAPGLQGLAPLISSRQKVSCPFASISQTAPTAAHLSFPLLQAWSRRVSLVLSCAIVPPPPQG